MKGWTKQWLKGVKGRKGGKVEVNAEISPQRNSRGGQALHTERSHLSLRSLGDNFFLKCVMTWHQYGMLNKRLQIHNW